MDKPIIVIHGIKFSDLCFVLDFAYSGQASVPHDLLDDFLKTGEFLQIRGLKEGSTHFISSYVQTTTATSTKNVNRSFDATISSSQETITPRAAKREREDDDIIIHEATEIMMNLLDPRQNITQEAARKPFTMTQTPPSETLVAPPNTAATKPKFTCRFCGRSLTSLGRIKRHENECTDNPDKVLAVCDICSAEMKPSSLTHHKNTKHGRSKGKTLLHPTEQSFAAQIPSLPSIIIMSGTTSTQMDDIGTTSTSPVQEKAADAEATAINGEPKEYDTVDSDSQWKMKTKREESRCENKTCFSVNTWIFLMIK